MCSLFQIDFFETSLMKELERRQTKQHFVDKIGRQFLVRLLIENQDLLFVMNIYFSDFRFISLRPP